MSDVQIIKPIAKYADVPLLTPFKPLAVAGTTLKEGALVYLLRQLPSKFLLTDFYDDTQHYNKVPIHGWNQHLIGPGLFQEWILTIKSARSPDEQNIELFQSSESHIFGFRTTRLVVPDEPLLAWFSLPQLRTICEKIKLTKVFKVEELLKSTQCPRCRIEQHYLNVLVAHVLLDQCHDPLPSTNVNVDEQLFIRTSPTKKQSLSPSLQQNPSSNIKDKQQQQQQMTFLSTDVSSYKMSVLDGTRTLEFTSLNDDGRQHKGHLCLFCGKVYNRKYGLKIHLRTHTGYKPLQCRVCSRPFSDPSNLNKHIRLHSIASSSIAAVSSSTLSQKRSFEELNINTDSDSDISDVNILDGQ